MRYYLQHLYQFPEGLFSFHGAVGALPLQFKNSEGAKIIEKNNNE